MNRFLSPVVLVILFVISSALAQNPAKIIWATDLTYNSATGYTDQGFVDFLTARGFSVTKRYFGRSLSGTQNPQLSAAEVAELEAADLVIMSRDTDPRRYPDAVGWNSLRVPMICFNPALVDSNHWQWDQFDVFPDTNMVLPSTPGDPIAVGIVPDGSPGGYTFTNTRTLLFDAIGSSGTARLRGFYSESRVFISTWEARERFSDSSPYAPGAPRMLFCAGRHEDYPGAGQIGAFNLTASGQQFLLNAIKIMLAKGEVLWVSDDSAGGGPMNDQPFVDRLKAEGYLVTRSSTAEQSSEIALGDGQPLTGYEKELLELFDLIVVSRDTNSGSYNDAAGWNGIRTPILLQNAYLARSSRWNWFKGTKLFSNNGLGQWIVGGPVGADCGPGGCGILTPSTITVPDTNSAGNGRLRARPVSSSPRVLEADWKASRPFYPGGAQTPADRRILMAVGEDGVNGDARIGSFNLTAGGEQLWLDAVDVLLADGEVIWVSDSTATGGLANDHGFVDMLQSENYLVSRISTLGDGNALTATEKELLNFADVVIVSRDTVSGGYNDATGWNGLTVPVINLNSYLARSNRWNWYPSTNLYVTGAALFPEIPGDPIFAGTSRNPNGGISFVTAPVEIPNITGIANGDFLGSPLSSEPRVWIHRWNTGTAFYEGTTNFAAGPRLLLPVGETGQTGSANIGRFNLAENGATILLNAVGAYAQ